MVSESELIGRLREFLRSSDLNTTTTATVRRQLEKDFGIDLSDRKAFIREQVDLFLQSEREQPEAEEDQKDEPQPEHESEEIEDCDNELQDDEERDEDTVKPSGNGKDKQRSKSSGSEVRRKGGGFCKLCSLSPQLQEFVGAPEMARTEVVKQLWAYIREKNLQDENNRRNIICDEPLRALFNVDVINMFHMNKVLSKHIWPLDSDDVIQVKSAPKEKQKKQEREEDEPKRKEKRQKGGKSGFLAPLQLSDALVNFLGTGENALSRASVIKRMWDYIKGNNLQDPSDKRKIICDEKLKELFNVDTFTGFTVSKLLAPHFIKAEQ